MIHLHAHADQMCRPGLRDDFDPGAGIAANCHSRMRDLTRYHTAPLKRSEVKCGAPDVNRSQCQMHSGGRSPHFAPRAEDVASPEAFAASIETVEALGAHFLP
jgi:hypothetical protein